MVSLPAVVRDSKKAIVIALNENIAGRLDEVSGYSPNREQTGSAFKRISTSMVAVRELSYPVSEIFAKEGFSLIRESLVSGRVISS